MSTDSVGVAVSESTSNSVPEPHSQHPQQNDGGSGKSSVAALSVESKPGEMSKSKWKDMLSRRQRVIVAATIAVLSVVIVAGLLYYFLAYRPAHAGSTGKPSNAITVDPNSPAVKAEFSAWMTKFDKKYLDADSLQNAYNNWLVNYAIVLNHDPTTAPGNLVLGLGPYADLTQQQFEKQMLTANAGMANTSTGGAAPDPQGDDLFSYYFNTNNVPTSLNWGTNPAMISPVKNQYSCGNCWAMAATEGVEVAYNVAYQPSSSIVLSVEQITSCDPYNGGCNGGWPHVVWEHYLAPGSGNYLTTEAIYPFNSANGITTPCNATAAATGIVELGGNPGWRWVTPPVSAWSLEAELLMIEALQTSPITVCVDARIWGGYYGGIMTNEAGCTGTGYVDHCVQLVGYTETYWIAKNQWGTGWGMNGFMYLARGENTCCILCYPTQVTLQLKAPYSSLGCFNDAATHALNIYIGTGFNVATCYAWAKAIGSAYFGLVGGTACYVGNTNYATYGNYGSPSFPGYPAGACAATCSDGSSGPCGGSWSVSVYQVNGVTPSCSTSQYWTETATGTSGNPVCKPCGGTATSAGGTATSCSRYELLGCFNDENPRALTLSISSATTIDSCYAYASANGYAYFGMEVGNECWVGNGNFAVYGSFGEPGTPAPAFASGPCANVGTDGVGPAGGPWALSVYKVNAVTISCPANYYYSVSQPSTMGNGVCLPCGASGLSAGGQPSSCYCPNSMTWAAGFGCQALEAAGCAAPASVATSTYCALGGSGVLVGLIPSDSYCAESNGVNAAFPAAGTITSISIQFASTPTASGVYKLKILTEQTPGSANFALVSESLFHPALTTAVQTVQLVTPLQVQAGQFFGFYSSNVGIASIPGTSVSYYQCGADFVSTSYTALTEWTSYLPNIQVFYQQGVGCSAPASVAVNTYCVSGGTGVIVSLPTSSAYCTEASGLSAAFSQEGIVNAVSVQFASAPSSSGIYTIKILEQQVVGSANFKVVAESNFYPAATTAVQTVFLANSLSVSAGQFFGFYSSNAGIASIPGSSVTYFECSANFEATTFTALSQWTSYHPNIEVFYTPVTPAWLGLGCLAPASAASSSYCSGGGSGVIVGFISGSEYCSGSTSSVGAFPSAGTVSAISIQFATAPTSTGVYKLKIVSQQSPGSANFLLVSESPFYPALTTAVQTVNLVTPLQVQAGQFYGFFSSNAGIASIPGTSQSYFECGLDFEATSYTALASWTGYLPNIEVFYQQGVGCSAPATVAVDSYCSAGGSGVIVSLPTGSGTYCTESSGLNAAFSQAGIVTAVSVQFASAPSSSGIYKVKILEQQSAASPANFILVSESVFYPAPTTALQTVLLQTPLAVSAGQFFGYYSSNVGIAAIPGSSTTYFQCSADFEATTFTALNLWNSYHPNIEVFLQ